MLIIVHMCIILVAWPKGHPACDTFRFETPHDQNQGKTRAHTSKSVGFIG